MTSPEVLGSCSLVLDEPGMTSLASGLAGQLVPPLVIYLDGELGAGKTTFARALIQAAGYPGRVKSPTYGIMEHYRTGEREFLHLDLYRIADTGELEFLGMEDLIHSGTVLLVEWPSRGEGSLPLPDLVIKMDHDGDNRKLDFLAYSGSGNEICEYLRALSK